MDLSESESMAKELIAFYIPHYSFKFDNAKRRSGLCDSKNRTIQLSKYFVVNNDSQRVRLTILHEIAHVLAGVENGHNKIWQSKCIEIGGNGRRITPTNKTQQYKYRYICDTCKFVFHRYRKMSSTMACKNCCKRFNNGKYSAEYILRLVEKC